MAVRVSFASPPPDACSLFRSLFSRTCHAELPLVGYVDLAMQTSEGLQVTEANSGVMEGCRCRRSAAASQRSSKQTISATHLTTNCYSCAEIDFFSMQFQI